MNRDGVTDIIVKATTDDGLVGWGESCSGANVTSVLGALEGMRPFVIGRSPWESERIRQELWHRGIWSWRQHTACFAYPGIDMALWDICGKASSQPLYNLFGGKVRESASYFFYCSQGSPEHVVSQAREGVEKGFQVFYLKVGWTSRLNCRWSGLFVKLSALPQRYDWMRMAAWRVNEALRNLDRLDEYKIDFIEQPVVQDPVKNMLEVRSRCKSLSRPTRAFGLRLMRIVKLRHGPLMSIASALTSPDPSRNFRSYLGWRTSKGHKYAATHTANSELLLQRVITFCLRYPMSSMAISKLPT